VLKPEARKAFETGDMPDQSNLFPATPAPAGK
jgi:hypothetical protein